MIVKSDAAIVVRPPKSHTFMLFMDDSNLSNCLKLVRQRSAHSVSCLTSSVCTVAAVGFGVDIIFYKMILLLLCGYMQKQQSLNY
jgi:hypothetical protein